jgi:hypothetical protein
MTDRYRRAMTKPPKGSNAQDRDADRLGAYPDAGELNSPQEAVDLDATGPDEPQPAGIDTEIIFTGGPGSSIGGPHATDRPGEAPGRPAEDRAATGGGEVDAPTQSGQRRPGPFVDRLR